MEEIIIRTFRSVTSVYQVPLVPSHYDCMPCVSGGVTFIVFFDPSTHIERRTRSGRCWTGDFVVLRPSVYRHGYVDMKLVYDEWKARNCVYRYVLHGHGAVNMSLNLSVGSLVRYLEPMFPAAE